MATEQDTLDRAEAQAEAKRQERYKVEQKISAHLERLALALDALADTGDKGEQNAYGLLVRREYTAARALVPAHKALDGSYYNITFQPFSDLYRD